MPGGLFLVLQEEFNSHFFPENSTRQRNFQSQYQLKVV